jgi:hypothetical protein
LYGWRACEIDSVANTYWHVGGILSPMSTSPLVKVVFSALQKLSTVATTFQDVTTIFINKKKNEYDNS